MDDLEEQLTRTRIEDEDGAIDRLCRQVALKCLHKKGESNEYIIGNRYAKRDATNLVNGHSVDVGVVDEPDDLIGEQLAVVLR